VFGRFNSFNSQQLITIPLIYLTHFGVERGRVSACCLGLKVGVSLEEGMSERVCSNNSVMQARRTVEQLRVEASMERIKVRVH
jgi:hypothetical protein